MFDYSNANRPTMCKNHHKTTVGPTSQLETWGGTRVMGRGVYLIVWQKTFSSRIPTIIVEKQPSEMFPQFYMARGCSVVECRTRNRESPGSKKNVESPLLPFRSLGIFVLFTTPQSTQLSK